jgi:recombination associated protein RdgC
MLFRNYVTYRLTQQIEFAQEALEQAMAAKLARPCEGQDLSTYGFVSPFDTKETTRTPESPALTMWVDKAILITARHEEKKLPPAAVRDEVDARVAAIEAKEQRKVYKKERDTIKDQVVLEFLPRAFIKRSITQAYIDLEQQVIIVDSASHKKAEDLLSTLREVIGSLPVRPISVKISPTASMTDWVKTQKAPADFAILADCTLKDTHDGGGTIVCKTQDLSAEELVNLIETGKVVTKLSIAFEDKLSLVLDEKLVMAKVRFEDLLKDSAAQDGGDDKAGQKQASFALMVGTNRLLLPKLLEVLGGEDIPQGI